jgi:hypothetical protein
MKRKLAQIIILLLLTIVFSRHSAIRQLSMIQEVSLPDGEESFVSDVQIEKKAESPSSGESALVSKEQQLPSAPAEKELLVLTVEVEKASSSPAPAENLPEETDIADAEEEGLSIVMISTCGSEEATENTASPAQDLSGVKGFRILGNSDDTPLDLVVRSSDGQGCEQIHFLDWNNRHPNKFTLHDALRGDTSVSVFEKEVQIAQFKVPPGTEEEYIALNLNPSGTLAYAQ